MKLFLIVVFLFIQIINNERVIHENQDKIEIIIDCNYTFEESTKGIEIPQKILEQLILIKVDYYSFDEKLHRGQLVINKKVEKDILEIFNFIKESRFPIAKVIPVVKYNWDDETSMNDNNTVAFNYREVKGSKVLSSHSYGMAIDINPLQNPHVKGNVLNPIKGKYEIMARGTIIRDSKLVNEFVKRGWQWGGRWKSSKDYQHFEKKS